MPICPCAPKPLGGPHYCMLLKTLFCFECFLCRTAFQTFLFDSLGTSQQFFYICQDGSSRVFWPILTTDLGSCFQWQKYVFFFIPISMRKFPILGTKTFSPFCDLITALCHSKLYFCILNLEMCLLVNQIFDVLF